MRLDLRLHGHIDDGRKCTADLAVYITNEAEKEKAVIKASETAPWLMEAQGWPDVPDGSTIVVDSVEGLQKKSNGKMIAPGVYAGSGPPGSFEAFLKQLGAGELVFPGMPPDDYP
jgi:hypothetical protein